MIYQKRFEILLLLVILVAAAGLRFANLTAVRHNVDQTYPIWQAMTTLDRGNFPIVGQATSVLFANPALTGYLYIPALLVNRSPVSVYVFVISLNTVAVLLCHLTVRRLLQNWRLGLVAAWLMAVNPWVIEYSRTTWVQSLLPFFVCAVAWLLFPVLTGQSTHPQKRLVAALVVMTLLTQTYLLAFLIVAPVGLLLLIFRRCIPVSGALVGGGVFAAATGLYGLSLLRNASTLSQGVEKFTGSESRLNSEALTHAVRLVTGDQYAVVRGATLPDAILRQNLELIVNYGLFALLILGMVFALIAIFRRQPERNAGIILLVWWALPIIAMSYTGNPVHPFYQLLGLPAGFALAAWGMKPLLKTFAGHAVIIVLLIPVGIVMGLNTLRFSEESYQTPGSYNLPLRDGLVLGAEINKNMPDGGVIFSEFDPMVLNSFTGKLISVIPDVRSPDVAIIPASGGIYLTLDSPANSSKMPAFATSESRLTLADGYTLHLSVYPQGGADLSTIPNPLNIPSDAGITFCCYELTQNRGGMWILTTYWRVTEADPLTSTDNFGTFAHIYNDQGERIQIVDGSIIPGYHWNQDDVHIHRMRFKADVPFTIQVGQYDATNAKNVIFIMPDGQYVPTVVLEGKITH